MNVKKLIARRRGIACACGDWTWDRCYDLKKNIFAQRISKKCRFDSKYCKFTYTKNDHNIGLSLEIFENCD
jgi:hypothetical protein